MLNIKKSCSHALLIFAGAVFGGFLCGHVWPVDASAIASTRHPRTITAEKFILVDNGGKQRGTMQVSADGMATVSLNDADGRDCAELRVARDGSAGLALFDQKGHELSVFGEGADGHSGIKFFGAQGRQVAAPGSPPTGESALTSRCEHRPGARGAGSRGQGRAGMDSSTKAAPTVRN